MDKEKVVMVQKFPAWAVELTVMALAAGEIYDVQQIGRSENNRRGPFGACLL